VSPEPTGQLHKDFSSPDATARPWSEVRDVLVTSEIFWLSTVRRDGRPHVTPIPAVWHADALHICTGPLEQKAKNLEANPHVVLTTGGNKLNEGLDVVVEGQVERVTDEPTLTELARLWHERLDWPYEVVEGGFHNEAGGLAHVFRVAPVKVLAFGKGNPFSQTRFRFR
jgi:nitroimidazol reductase NimA-like FMN-containing flavoprotein (pyridoxamine 5'-phosphate oxidase superfamily)